MAELSIYDVLSAIVNEGKVPVFNSMEFPIPVEFSKGADIAGGAATWGTPVNAVEGTLTTSLTGSNNDMTFTAKTAGDSTITVEYVAEVSSTLGITVDEGAITVQLATTAGDAATAAFGSGDNGVVTVTAATAGTAGNDLTIEVVVSEENDASLAAAIDGNDILVTLGTDADGAADATKNTATLVAAAIHALTEVNAEASGTGATAITEAVEQTSFTGGGANFTVSSTAANVKTAIEADTDANALVTVANADGNNGSGTVTAMEATALTGGVNGTVAEKGAQMVDATYLYVCIADNTVAGKNWRRIALGSAF